ncbi:hypothetical protein IFR09_19810 [Pseudomonas syringae]|nr:hypothetical protein [Pseudomonas syringae]MBD8574313.1 hypothetical protein [Pseudomonas syringae]MBD8791946.1 hypothetical protein [Pseudomonas syringae]MBD8801170.1 hypothetical protein [Pseudomonas syringae]MBD8813411.1 hypothetical protein [Pseudomonas syringae]
MINESMPRFAFYHGHVLVGHSGLEHQDPSMGVAFGRFEPADGYEAIRTHCRTHHTDQAALALVAHAPGGKVITCQGVSILDDCDDLQGCIEVTVFAMASALFQALFPARAP